MKNPFRYGCVVEGEYFCPRPDLERQMRRCAEDGQNIVVEGERRMGKTSLVRKAVLGLKGERLLYIDLYSIRTLEDFCRRVMVGISHVTERMSFLKRAVQLAYRLRPVITLDPVTGSPTISVDARAAEESGSLTVVMETIRKLAEEGKLCVVFDEFQDILKLEDGDRILAEMRSTIQFQADTPYFFLGSVRNEMLRIFTSPDSPFFKSAALFSIGEIDTEEFARFVVTRFKKGARKVGLEMAKTIISFARGVSGDVQELCDALWSVTDESAEIVESDIAAALGVVFSRERNGFDAIVADLTPNQFTVLRGLAENEDSRVFTAEFMNRVRMTSPGSVKRVLNKLVALRVIYLYRSQYKFANPFFREWLRRELR